MYSAKLRMYGPNSNDLWMNVKLTKNSSGNFVRIDSPCWEFDSENGVFIGQSFCMWYLDLESLEMIDDSII